MQRREFITLLSGTATASLVLSRVAFAQLSTKVFRIGFLGLPTANSQPERLEAFRAGLRELGYREGQDFVIESRWADGKYDQLATLLADLIRLRVDVIVTSSTPGALAAKQATTTIPIVVAAIGDALASGIASSLALRPRRWASPFRTVYSSAPTK
jgi:putative ABC transport system substrate-binding protein